MRTGDWSGWSRAAKSKPLRFGGAPDFDVLGFIEVGLLDDHLSSDSLGGLCAQAYAPEFCRGVLTLVEAGRRWPFVGVSGQVIYGWRRQLLIDSGSAAVADQHRVCRAGGRASGLTRVG